MAATRYVWEWYRADHNALANPGSSLSKYLNNAYFAISTSQPQAEMLVEGDYAGKPFYRGSGSQFTASGTTKSYAVSTYGKYLYTFGYGNSVLCVVPDVYSNTLDMLEWVVGNAVYLRRKSSGESLTFNTYEPQVTKGEYLGVIGSKSSTTYKNGYDGSTYWYVYKGSETIDPTDIYLTSPKIVPGQTATVNVVAPTSKYCGVYYYVSYSVNGGSYQSLPGQEEKIFTFTVPSNAESLRLRVYARSDGEVNSSYVYSATYYANEAPSAPPSVSVPDVIDPGVTFTVTWSAATDPDGNLSGYEIQRTYNGGSAWSSVTSTADTSVQTSVERGYKTVRYRVRAYDSKGEDLLQHGNDPQSVGLCWYQRQSSQGGQALCGGKRQGPTSGQGLHRCQRKGQKIFVREV